MVANRCSPDLSGERPNLLRKQHWLLERCEMAAALWLVPVDQLREELLCPVARRRKKLTRGHTDANGEVNCACVLRHADLCMLGIDACRRRRSVGQPVERDVVQHLVARECVFGVALVVGPGVELLVNPGRLAGGRVRERVADRLRLGGLEREVAELVGLEALLCVDRALLRRGQLLGELVEDDLRHRDVDRGKAGNMQLRHSHRHERAPVAILRNVARVPSRPINSPHALAIRSAFQPRALGLSEKPKPGSDGATK